MDPITAIIILVASVALSYALQPKPQTPEPASMKDINIPTAEEGKPIGVVFGRVVVKSPNVIWYGDLRTDSVKTKSGK